MNYKTKNKKLNQAKESNTVGFIRPTQPAKSINTKGNLK